MTTYVLLLALIGFTVASDMRPQKEINREASLEYSVWHDDDIQPCLQDADGQPLLFDFWPPGESLQEEDIDIANSSDLAFHFDPNVQSSDSLNVEDDNSNLITEDRTQSGDHRGTENSTTYDDDDQSLMAMLHRAEQTPEVRLAIELRQKKKMEQEAREAFKACAFKLGYKQHSRSLNKRFTQYAKRKVIESLRSGNDRKVERATKFLLARRKKGNSNEEAACRNDERYISDEEYAESLQVQRLDALPRVLELATVNSMNDKTVQFWKECLRNDSAQNLIEDLYSRDKRIQQKALYDLSRLSRKQERPI